MSPLWVAVALAHPATPSTLTLDVGRQQVAMALHIPRDQLEMALSGSATWDPTAPRPEDGVVVDYVREHLALTSDGRGLPLSVAAPTWTGEGEESFVDLVVVAQAAGPLGRLRLHDAVVSERVRSHRTHVVLRGDVGAGVDAAPRMVGLLNGAKRSLELPTEPAGVRAVAAVAFDDGLTHVLGGVDHLLFLLELLVAVPLAARRGRWGAVAEGVPRRLLSLLSAFTVGHGLTLGAVALGVVHLPGPWVEAWVAASVVLAAVHLWRPLWPGREGLFAGAAGLVHGAAFAEGLVGSGLAARELALPLVAFDLGIEAAQLLVALGCAPLWWTAARHPALRRAVALCGGLAGLVWLWGLAPFASVALGAALLFAAASSLRPPALEATTSPAREMIA